MESRIRRIFLSLVLGAVAATAARAAEQPAGQVIEPEIERREITEAAIDTEDFEIGAYAGLLATEDFGTNPVYGARFGYHVTEDVFVEAAYARSNTDETSFERLSGNIQLISDDDRLLSYWNLSFGFNLLPGEGFVADRWAFTTAFYLIGGVGSTSFAGDDLFTWNVGAGYRLLANDWLSLRIEARDHVFDLDLLGDKRTYHNLEYSLGLSVFF